MPDTADTDLKGRAARKSATAYRTISEVSEELDVPQHVLRFWETKFSQVRPMKRGGGRRYYRPEDVLLLRRIQKLLYQDGYTIKGVQRLLREGRTEHGGHESVHPDTGPAEPGGAEDHEPPDEHAHADEAGFDEAEDAADEAAGEEPPSEAIVGVRPPRMPAAPPPPSGLPPKLREDLTALLAELRHLRAVLRGGGG